MWPLDLDDLTRDILSCAKIAEHIIDLERLTAMLCCDDSGIWNSKRVFRLLTESRDVSNVSSRSILMS
jgi:hypothetical protein